MNAMSHELSLQITPARIITAAYLVVWLVGLLRNLGYRRLSRMVRNEVSSPAGAAQPVSVIITTHNHADLVRQNLHAYLEQDHPEFEVIVVDMNSDDDTCAYLKDQMELIPQLHLCKLPATLRDISPQRLAITLGIRSAHYNRVLLTDITCRPATRQWLRRMSAHATDNRQIVLGYTQFVNARGWRGLRYRFFHIWQQMLLFTQLRNGRAYRALPTNLIYSKEAFLRHKGFADHATLIEGATEIMVNQQSTHANTAVCLHPDAFLLQDTPNDRATWRTQRLFFMETRRHFTHTFRYRSRYTGSVALTWLLSLATLGALVLLLLCDQPPYPYAIGVALLWVAHGIQRDRCFHQSLKAMNEPSMHLALPLLLHAIVWWNLKAWLRHRFCDRRIFRKRFV